MGGRDRGRRRRVPGRADGKVFVENGPNKLLCLDAATGKKVWDVPVPDKVHGSPPAVSDGKVFVAKGDDGVVLCVEAATGARVWSSPGGQGCASPAVADGKVFVDGNLGEGGATVAVGLVCLAADTGKKVWEFEAKANLQSAPTVADGRVHASDMAGNIFCVDAAKGTEVWTFAAPSKTPAITRPLFTGVVVTDGKVFAGAQDDRVVALDAATGRLLYY